MTIGNQYSLNRRNHIWALNFLEDPSKEQFGDKCKGLVLGYVQSGKTANFCGLIAKAADSGYNLIIVLAGITNTLRNQTQKRLLSDLSINDKKKDAEKPIAG